jgi:hypothetical protein
MYIPSVASVTLITCAAAGIKWQQNHKMMKTISFLQQPFERFIPAREVEITKTLNFEAYVIIKM